MVAVNISQLTVTKAREGVLLIKWMQDIPSYIEIRVDGEPSPKEAVLGYNSEERITDTNKDHTICVTAPYGGGY